MSDRLTFGLIGDPVAHSLSPAMHRAAFAVLGIDADYVSCRVPAGEVGLVEAEMRRLAGHGGGNVTIPHKGAAARIVETPSAVVRRLAACNCFWQSTGGTLAGENTDVAGIRNVLESADVGRDSALVLGAGGAAAATCLALSELGMRSVTIRNRSPERARRLAERLAGLDISVKVTTGPPSGVFDLAVNATSLGLDPTDSLPMAFEQCVPGVALDLVYSSRPTRWAAAAEAAGIDWIDGREVLLQQGAACYEHWLGVTGPVEAMRGALFGDTD